ncbi:hypothetical protein QJS04_geneDACA018606 [Acorus gramineus]|uniref:Peptidase S54 rhomboid domain-containing protein n=1 Tax=Acorus gramineus TaxID=55184 RepID=A0AAV9AIL9_ACOGR|nr:hypothetical protein QJS04_geneDACA018606 [Acorus gramineus]
MGGIPPPQPGFPNRRDPPPLLDFFRRYDSSFQNLFHSSYLSRIKRVSSEKPVPLKRDFWGIPAIISGDNGFSRFLGNFGNSLSRRSTCTDALLSMNILFYMAQVATRGRLTAWGCLVNNTSLDHIGRLVEDRDGPRKFLAVYFTSALTGSAMSYCFLKSSSLGASDSIFGLAIGLVSQRINNWAHLGGLLGGAAVSWFICPPTRLKGDLISTAKGNKSLFE